MSSADSIATLMFVTLMAAFATLAGTAPTPRPKPEQPVAVRIQPKETPPAPATKEQHVDEIRSNLAQAEADLVEVKRLLELRQAQRAAEGFDDNATPETKGRP